MHNVQDDIACRAWGSGTYRDLVLGFLDIRMASFWRIVIVGTQISRGVSEAGLGLQSWDVKLR